jgi:deoxyribodipyrimidine photo-lyase
LESLTARLEKLGLKLSIYRGAAADILQDLAEASNAAAAFWSRRYGAAERAIDEHLKSVLRDAGVDAHSFNDRLLAEPWEVKTASGGAFQVFTPFWRALRAKGSPAAPLTAPKKLRGAPAPAELVPLRLEGLDLLPTKPDWADGLREAWTPGEAGARKRLSAFVGETLAGYASHRDRPDIAATSRLSPHLRFGEISPRQIWHAAWQAAEQRTAPHSDVEKFLSEIGWREFSNHLLFHNPTLATRNFNARFDAFAWRTDRGGLKAWQAGRTGVPMVDAGMRELWRTGIMHNRVRMLVASFLTKHLLIDWRKGEAWFWDTLVDADPANNPASWQWVAGSGADAAPYFRVFNPVLQGEKFDPRGAYVRRWVPEIAKLPDKLIHQPWAAPADVLKSADIELGRDYPRPVVDLGDGRTRALATYQSTRN